MLQPRRHVCLLNLLLSGMSPTFLIVISNTSLRITSSGPSRRVSQLLRAATQVKTFSYTDQLTSYLKNNFILHEPGRFLIIPKPYGVSCVGEPQKEGGVFENSVYNRKDSDDIPMRKLIDRSVTISECVPGLARLFNEPGLSFCTGLKRS
ncbi:hypothetical protein Y032_0092g2532 [Ancylostoma ceylanicum]|uniref:Uncharacterized protein n=1 Tax=Ancylostoma ceylanicum TaxID=53326 RepID=A0A016TM87_9BILA|nr:hypothetical protein Y032_0092g2532 [Ancylostoma ceylanicum]